jgi:16S rRNA (cytosine1402-N4)-methyltransferase
MSWQSGLANWECFENNFLAMNEIFHKPAMLKEVLEALDPKPGRHFVDATLGAGGHAQAILERTAPEGKLLGIERDPEMLAIACERLASFGSRLIPVCATYDQMHMIAKKRSIGPITGVLFDLGLSSWHLERSKRGFSFQRDEPLDMRFNPAAAGPTAADLLRNFSEEELARVFEEYGEEPYAKRIARAIVLARKRMRFERTDQLVRVITAIKRNVFLRKARIHPATKIFQALRIAVNRELEFLAAGFKAAEKTLDTRGSVAVIAFHGLEAKIIKKTFRLWEHEQKGRRIPKHPIAPLREEIRVNPRARSARLYIFQHI